MTWRHYPPPTKGNRIIKNNFIESYGNAVYHNLMFTLIESPLFSRLWPDYWTEDERGRFAAWLAENPDSGDLVPGSGGIRKIRWSKPGQGKRGGVRIIYYAQIQQSMIWLLTIYAKSHQENAPAHILKALKQELVDDEK